MTPRVIFTFLGKLIFCVLAFVAGMLLGGIISSKTGLPAPTMPPGMDANRALMALLATSPLFVLALYLVGRKLAGGWLARTWMLALLAWIAYSVNNVIEAVVFSSYAMAPWFTLINFAPAVLLCAGVVAWLFPSRHGDQPLIASWRAYFQQRTANAWTWRLLLAAPLFMPVYYLFGLLVVPFVGDYYRQGAFGLAIPPLSTLLLVLFVRSVLFLVACLPVVIAWQGSARTLWLSLGLALFVLVGLIYMLMANWLPPAMRIIHALEILADSLVYAGALIWLLSGSAKPHIQSAPAGSFDPVV